MTQHHNKGYGQNQVFSKVKIALSKPNLLTLCMHVNRVLFLIQIRKILFSLQWNEINFRSWCKMEQLRSQNLSGVIVFMKGFDTRNSFGSHVEWLEGQKDLILFFIPVQNKFYTALLNVIIKWSSSPVSLCQVLLCGCK